MPFLAKGDPVKMLETENKTEASRVEGGASENDFRALYTQSLNEIKEGSIVDGSIIEIRRDEVLIDIGYKSEGVVSIREFSNREDLQPGNRVAVLLERLEDEHGMVVLSKHKADKIQNWEKTISNCGEGTVVKGKVFKKVKGGLMVDIGMEAFLPASQIDIKHVRNIDEFLGKVYEFKVIKINTDRKNVVLSRRQLLEETRKRDKAKLLQEISVGDVRSGRVKNITDFGAFIDLNGGDGLLHITDMTWGRINHPSEMVAIGDELEVMILDFDLEKERISLGLKQRSENPWDKIEEKFQVNSKVKGKVVNTMPYGVFVELEKGIEGLIHVTELSWTRRFNHPSELLNVGDEVEAMVLNVDKENQKISLGLKQLEATPWDNADEKFPVNSKIKGIIRNLTNYGAFVELEDGLDGLIHVSDISWTKKVNNASEVFKKGDEVEAIVLSVDQDAKKISLGIKQLENNPWDNISEHFQLGDVVNGVVSKVAGFGIFVELKDGIEGLVHNSQISDDQKSLKEGDTVTAKVVKVDQEEKKIALSMRDGEPQNSNRASNEDIRNVLGRDKQITSDFADKISEAIEKGDDRKL